MMFPRGFLAAAMGLALCGAGCGFHPVYAPGGPEAAALPAVYVNIIPNRAGQLLRQALQARLAGTDDAVAKRYTLSVSYAEATEALGVQVDNSVTRVRDVGRATWTLHPLANDTVQLGTGTVRNVDGYNVIDEQFFYQDLSEEATQHRLADALADQIVTGLAVYFQKHPDKT